MAGSSIEYDREFASVANGMQTILLIGRTGNGKSSTGNSIIGRKVFQSKSRASGVTRTCELHSTVLEDGQILNVIDTPGLFDFSAEPEFVGKLIGRFIGMAKDGIHAVVVVLSARSRFSKEEAAAINSFQTMFGREITNNMVVVFTGGDELEENDETLDDYLGRECPEPLKELLDICGNRRVLFDNKTADNVKKNKQLKQLLSLVNDVAKNNGAESYTYQLADDQSVAELDEAILKIKQRIEEARAARMAAEESAQKAQMESDEEIYQLREDLESAKSETEELRVLVAARRKATVQVVLSAVKIIWGISSIITGLHAPVHH